MDLQELLSDIQRRLNLLEAGQQALVAEKDAVAAHVAALQEESERGRDRLEGFDDALQALVAEKEAMGGHLEGLQEESERGRARLEGFDDALRALVAEKEALGTHLGTLQLATERLEREQGTNQQDIASLQEQVAKLIQLWGDLQATQRELATLLLVAPGHGVTGAEDSP